MNGVFETERSVEFLGLDQIGNRKTNIPQKPLLSASPTPRLLASGAVQPVWDNVTVYSRTGPHTFTEGGGEWGCVFGGGIHGDRLEKWKQEEYENGGKLSDGPMGKSHGGKVSEGSKSSEMGMKKQITCGVERDEMRG